MISILKSQLEASNATNMQLNLVISRMSEEMKEMRSSFELTNADLHKTIDDLRKTIANLEGLLTEKNIAFDKIGNELRSVKSLAFKPSEKQKPSVQKAPEEIKEEQVQKAVQRKARGNNGAKRKEHFELDVVETDVYPENVDKDLCIEIGVRNAIRYTMVPPKFIKNIYHIHTLKNKEDGVIYSGKAPLAPLQNSSFDGSFIAGIAELRYLQSMPVERIVKYFQAHGFNLEKQTAHALLGKTAGLFENLYKAMQSAVKESVYLNCDETYHTVLVDANNNDGKGSKKGYIWVIASSKTGLTYFIYDEGSRKQEVILKELAGHEGVIQSDGLGAYKRLAEQSGGKIVRVACLQHCKRSFLDDSLKNNADANKVVKLSNLLYHNEHQHQIGKDGWTTEDNLRWRQEYAPPILKELKAQLEQIRSDEVKYPPKSLMHKSANYFLNEWKGIEAIASYGDVAWDNNLIERTNRYISLSRHNSLFFGSHAGAQRGCIFYSLACSCRNRGIDFFDYLSDVLNKSAAMPNGAPPEAYRDLLPDRWSPSENK